MTKVRTFSRVFPSYHPRKGEPTYFVEKILRSIYGQNPTEKLEEILWLVNGFDKDDSNKQLIFDLFFSLDWRIKHEPKGHTIRAGHHFKVGDWFSPRVWSGVPYKSKQIIIAPNIQVKKTWDFKAHQHFTLNGRNYFGEHESNHELLEKIALNDGLSKDDFLGWFHWFTKPFDGQIICWNESIEY